MLCNACNLSPTKWLIKQRFLKLIKLPRFHDIVCTYVKIIFCFISVQLSVQFYVQFFELKVQFRHLLPQFSAYQLVLWARIPMKLATAMATEVYPAANLFHPESLT